MALCSRHYYRLSSQTPRIPILGIQFVRHTSSAAQVSEKASSLPTNAIPYTSEGVISPLSRLSTATLFRRLFMCTFFTSRVLFTPGLAVMNVIANSKSWLLNPDKNKLLRKMIKPLVYDQFCAGTNRGEIQHTIGDIKGLGFSGVGLIYGKEAQAGETSTSGQLQEDPDFAQWKEGMIETLSMVGDGDYLAMKITGAGRKVMKALESDESPTPEFMAAMDIFCEQAKAKGCRIWIDAEQQAVEGAIDKWTIELMRKWNRDTPLIYNTTQAYLKEARSKLQSHLQLAQQEGWAIGVKLVRGAYIHLDRAAVHDTKEQTDECYESIVRDLLHGRYPGLETGPFPRMALLLCGHNPGTITRASELAQKLSREKKLYVKPEFAQLLGMADDIGCELVQSAQKIRLTDTSTTDSDRYEPRVYKCLTWGTIQECMQYLVRRAVENRGASDRIKDDTSLFAGELRRRFTNAFRFQPQRA